MNGMSCGRMTLPTISRQLRSAPPASARPAAESRLLAGAAAAEALAARRAGGAGGGAGAGLAVGGHAEVHGLEPLDLVAQAGRLLELQVRRGGPHLRLEIGYHGLQVVADQRRLVR